MNTTAHRTISYKVASVASVVDIVCSLAVSLGGVRNVPRTAITGRDHWGFSDIMSEGGWQRASVCVCVRLFQARKNVYKAN